MCKGDWASVAGTSPTHWGLQTSWCRTPDDTRRVLLTLCCRVRTVFAAQEWTAQYQAGGFNVVADQLQCICSLERMFSFTLFCWILCEMHFWLFKEIQTHIFATNIQNWTSSQGCAGMKGCCSYPLIILWVDEQDDNNTALFYSPLFLIFAVNICL